MYCSSFSRRLSISAFISSSWLCISSCRSCRRGAPAGVSAAWRGEHHTWNRRRLLAGASNRACGGLFPFVQSWRAAHCAPRASWAPHVLMRQYTPHARATAPAPAAGNRGARHTLAPCIGRAQHQRTQVRACISAPCPGDTTPRSAPPGSRRRSAPGRASHTCMKAVSTSSSSSSYVLRSEVNWRPMRSSSRSTSSACFFRDLMYSSSLPLSSSRKSLTSRSFE